MFRHPLAAGLASISPRLLSIAGFVLAALLCAVSLPGQDGPTVKTADTIIPPDQKVTTNRPILPNETAPIPQKEIYRRLLKSTAYIVNLDKDGNRLSTGSGWLLDKDRKLVVTNNHVIESLDTIRIYFPKYNNDRLITDPDAYWKTAGIPAEILIADAKKDLAVLRLAELPPGVEAAVLADESPSPGEVVCSIGSPKGSGALFVLSTGSVRSVYHTKFSDFDATIVETQSPVFYGDSGGPAVNDRNQLVGVVFSFQTTARLASNFIDLSEVKTFAQRANRVYEPKTADLFVERGLNAKENKRLDAAIGDFTSALKLQPKHAVAFARRADCFREQRDYKTALSDYNDAIAADPKLSSAFTGRALALRAQRKFDDALADATTAIRLRPDYYHPAYLRGLVYLDKQDPSSALPDFERALKLAEKIPVAKHQTLSDRARAHEMAGEYSAAFDDYIAALNIKGDDMNLYRRLGDMLLDKANDPQKAFHAANVALGLKPNYFYSLLHRGRALIALKNSEEGLRDLAAAIRAAENKTQLSLASLQRGMVFENRNEIEPAAKDYLSAIESNANDSRAYIQLANLMIFKANNPSACAQIFTTVIENQPKSAQAYLARGRAFLYLSQYDKSAADLDEAIRLNPKNAASHAYRGDLNLTRRELDGAVRDYNAALKLNSQHPIYHYQLAETYAAQGELKAANKSLDAAISLNPKYSAAYHNRSIARYRLGDQAGSRADMQTARSLDPELKNKEVKLRYSNYLNVKNGTSEPLVVYFQYYTPTADGSFRWYPAAPGSDSQPLRVHLEPGEGTGLIDPNYKGMNIKGARFRIWARGLNSNRDYIQYRDTDLVAVPKEGYVGSDYGATTYTFR